jgi:hypothetical protein
LLDGRGVFEHDRDLMSGTRKIHRRRAHEHLIYRIAGLMISRGLRTGGPAVGTTAG